MGGPAVPYRLWNSNYAGVYRAPPFFVEDAEQASELARLFEWYISHEDPDCVHDLALAKEYRDVLNRCVGAAIFEVIRVTTDLDEVGAWGCVMRGYDLAKEVPVFRCCALDFAYRMLQGWRMRELNQ